MNAFRTFLLLANALLATLPVTAADGAKASDLPAPADLTWWREARFGLFLHWGPVSLKGTEIGWSRGGPYRPGAWGASTHRGRTVFLHVLNWQDQESLVLPPLEAEIRHASLLGGGTVDLRQQAQNLEVHVPKARQAPIDTVICLTLASDVTALAPR